MNEINIKPSIIKTFYQMVKDLEKFGFTQRDIVLMLQDRTKPRLGLNAIKIMLKAIIQFENDFKKFHQIISRG